MGVYRRKHRAITSEKYRKIRESDILHNYLEDKYSRHSLSELQSAKLHVQRSQKALRQQYLGENTDLTQTSPLDAQYTVEQHRQALYHEGVAIKRILKSKYNIR